MRRILVTGDCGYIGSNLKHFASGYDQFIGYDIKNGQDILDQDLFERTVIENDVNVVVHLASKRNVTWCENNKEEAYLTNYKATCHIADICAKHKIKLIFVSSQSVKGEPNVYAATKYKSEQYLKLLSKKLGLMVAVLRLTNVVGNLLPYPFHAEYPSLTDNIVNSIKYNDVLSVYGNAKRNYVHVNDVVQGLMSFITFDDYAFSYTGYEQRLICSDLNLTTHEYIEYFERFTNQKIRKEFQPSKSFETIDLSVVPSTILLNDGLGEPPPSIKHEQYLKAILQSYSFEFTEHDANHVFGTGLKEAIYRDSTEYRIIEQDHDQKVESVTFLKGGYSTKGHKHNYPEAYLLPSPELQLYLDGALQPYQREVSIPPNVHHKVVNTSSRHIPFLCSWLTKDSDTLTKIYIS